MFPSHVMGTFGTNCIYSVGCMVGGLLPRGLDSLRINAKFINLLYKCKGTWYKFKFSEKRSLETSFPPHGMTYTKKFRNCIESLQKKLSDIVVLTVNSPVSENAWFLFCPVLEIPCSCGSIVCI